MSLQPESVPRRGSLAGAEGELVSVHICAGARRIERVLDALRELPFPVNPQIYHDAAVGYVYPDGTERWERAILIEFPAFAARLPDTRRKLTAAGIEPELISVRGMLDDIHDGQWEEAAAPGSAYRAIRFYRHAAARV